ncbi:helix-turn-helix transcriptional regulator [Lignipirellula cremea]|uniref:helix-turn-helix transcriptional regulator n=1 Tax=Lignipirellula cremea TaxID=2528010 RepID=UPI001E3E5563|nr:transcriptional regulator [Lignipirellula cremea]
MHAGELAERCDVSRRTIFRDLDALRQAGVPLVFEPSRQAYHIPGQYFLPPTNFTADEALAVISLCHQLGGPDKLPFFAAAASAAVKLEQNLPGRLRSYLHSLSTAVKIKIDAANPLAGKQPFYEQLVSAISQLKSVRITYGSLSEGETISTRLSPYQLLFHYRSWYVIGRSSLHRSVRTFNVGRIAELTQLEDKYQIPQGFSLDRHLRNAWRMIPEPGPDAKIVIHFQPKVARNVAEVLWHKTQQTTFLDNGVLEFRCTVSGLEEISWWILGYGDEATVKEPPELRQLIVQRARRLLAQYEDE